MNRKATKHLLRAQELLDFGIMSAINEKNFKRLYHVGKTPTNVSTACAACALKLLGVPPRFIEYIENHEDVNKHDGIWTDDLLHVIHRWEAVNGAKEKGDFTKMKSFNVPGDDMIKTVHSIWAEIRPGYGTLLLVNFRGKKTGHYVAAFLSANELRPSIFDTQHIHEPSRRVSVEGYKNIAHAFEKLDVTEVHVFSGGMGFDSSHAEYTPTEDVHDFMSRSPSELEREKRPIKIPSDPMIERETLKKRKRVQDIPPSLLKNQKLSLNDFIVWNDSIKKITDPQLLE